MIFIGNRKVLFSETVLCPESESINIKIKIPNEETLWDIQINFTEEEKKEGSKNKPQPHLNYRTEEDLWVLDFVNWTSSLGASFSTPAEIAVSVDDKPITLLAEVAKLAGGLYRANIQIMIEEGENV